MNVLVIGCGRMGIRHCIGLMSIPQINKIVAVDVNDTALKTAQEQLSLKENYNKLSFYNLDVLFTLNHQFDIIVIAATAGDRLGLCEKIIKLNPKHVLVEKPLGQSLNQVKELIAFFDKNQSVKAYVNLNTRLYPAYNKLKSELKTWPQFNKGIKTISINTGTLGIGANGIHYIDLIKYLLDADKLELISCGINEQIIPSGRGQHFCDFGGWAVIDYKNSVNELLGTAHLILGSNSTAYGPWEIVGMHGRILIDEIEQTKQIKLRKEDSQLPIQRYAADYLPIKNEIFDIPNLSDLTNLWLTELLKGNSILPQIKNSLEVHEIMYSWLSKSKTHQEIFPIT